jgi:methylated-DNA-[protein]-cysteine S-methyltransferase
MSENCTVVDTPFGTIGVAWRNDVLTRMELSPEDFEKTGEPLPDFVAEKLDAYFRDGSSALNLPIKLQGTPFQRRVWKALREIPPGRTITYSELGRKLGSSARAVGGACRANPCPIVVPCHRVVAVNGLGGFSGDTSGHKLETKRWLLRHEGNKDF